MTTLEKQALGVLPLSSVTVGRMLGDAKKHPLSDRAEDIRRLCLSHERLRMEAEGAELLLGEREPSGRYAGEPNPVRAEA